MRSEVERIRSILARHRNSPLLIDSNLLILWLIGKTDVALVGRFKRTSSFEASDFRLLDNIIGALKPRLITTPNILTEVSNLATTLHGTARSRFSALLKSHIVGVEERFVPSESASSRREFSAFGLTDCAIIELCGALRSLVVTADALLAETLRHLELDAINFNHLRPLKWD